MGAGVAGDRVIERPEATSLLRSTWRAYRLGVDERPEEALQSTLTVASSSRGSGIPRKGD
jgi:hypothetical protein